MESSMADAKKALFWYGESSLHWLSFLIKFARFPGGRDFILYSQASGSVRATRHTTCPDGIAGGLVILPASSCTSNLAYEVFFYGFDLTFETKAERNESRKNANRMTVAQGSSITSRGGVLIEGKQFPNVLYYTERTSFREVNPWCLCKESAVWGLGHSVEIPLLFHI